MSPSCDLPAPSYSPNSPPATRPGVPVPAVLRLPTPPTSRAPADTGHELDLAASVLTFETPVVLQAAYQRIEDAAGVTVAHEALARPQNDISPALLARVAPWETLAAMLDLVVASGIDTPVFVNVDPLVLAAFPDRCLRALVAANRVRPVAVELTERGRLTHRAAGVVTELAARGVEVWLDDFGTGASTARERLEILGRDVVWGIKLAPEADATTREEAAASGAVLLQEGIESLEGRSVALDAGVELFQGWALGCPWTHKERTTVVVRSFTNRGGG